MKKDEEPADQQVYDDLWTDDGEPVSHTLINSELNCAFFLLGPRITNNLGQRAYQSAPSAQGVRLRDQ